MIGPPRAGILFSMIHNSFIVKPLEEIQILSDRTFWSSSARLMVNQHSGRRISVDDHKEVEGVLKAPSTIQVTTLF
jgi:hypothetical protein